MDKEVENILKSILREIRFLRKQNQVWMGIEDLSDYIGLKTSTIYQYVNQQRIPFRKIPGSSRLIFSREQIDEWIEGGGYSDPALSNARKEANRIWGDIQERHG